MKYWVLIFSIILSLNSFGQLIIDQSKTIVFNKSQILNNKSEGSFIETFLISNTEDQPFITANIVLEGNFIKDVEFLVRYKTSGWSKWESIVEDIHLKEEGFVFKEMFFLPKGTSEFEVKTQVRNNIKKLRINFYYPGFTEKRSSKNIDDMDVEGTQSVNCNCPIPAFESRLDWCPSGNCPSQQNPTYTTVTHLIVHHAAGQNTSSDWAATVRSIWNFHTNATTSNPAGNGWSDIGYNYLIAPDGTIFEGRGDNVLGAHFSGMNGGTMGICLLGDYEPTSGNGTPSNIMISKLEELLSWKECDLDIDPLLSAYHNASSQTLLNISGHRDAGTGTLCPGDNVYNLLSTIRTTCSSYMTNCTFVADADLVVSSVSTNPANVFFNQNVTVDYAIGNGGSQSVTDSIIVELKIDGVLVETNYLDSLSGGELENFSLPNYIFDTIGNHDICIYISHASNETNVANNSFCKTINVIEDLDFSDITISSFYVNNDNINITDEANIIFNFKNVGDVSTSEPVAAKIKVDNVVRQLINIPVLSVNDSYSDNFYYNFNTIGQHEFCLEIESPINEMNTSNNSDCELISVFPINGVENFENIIELNVFPNPVDNLLQVDLSLNNKEEVVYELKNILGQSVLLFEKESAAIHQEKIDLTEFASGIYILNIKIGKNSINKSIVIE